MKALAATEILQAGTQIRVSHHLARGMILRISSANFFVSVAVMFIFQFPAMTVLRYLRFMIVILLYIFDVMTGRSARGMAKE